MSNWLGQNLQYRLDQSTSCIVSHNKKRWNKIYFWEFLRQKLTDRSYSIIRLFLYILLRLCSYCEEWKCSTSMGLNMNKKTHQSASSIKKYTVWLKQEYQEYALRFQSNRTTSSNSCALHLQWSNAKNKMTVNLLTSNGHNSHYSSLR